MAISGISGLSGLSGLGIGGEEVLFPALNTSGLLVRFATNNTSKITTAASNAVTSWSPEQLGALPTFDLLRSNTVNTESPVFVPSDPTFGEPAITIGFNNKAMHANTMNSQFANSTLTTFIVGSFIDPTPRNGLFVRYRNDASPFTKVEMTTVNIGGTNRLRFNSFNPASTFTQGSGNANNTKLLITWTHQANRQIIRVNGTAVVDSFAPQHWNTVGVGHNFYLGGTGIGVITEECTQANVLDLSMYKGATNALIDDVENTLATYYGISLP